MNETIDLNELRAFIAKDNAENGPVKSWADGIPTGPKPEPELCKNAFAGMNAWYCYDFNGKRTPGKETLNFMGECEACAKVIPGDDNPVSFKENEE